MKKLYQKYVWRFDDDQEKKAHEQLIENNIKTKNIKTELIIICAGNPRTGTTSLRNALNILGFPCYDLSEVFQLNDQKLWSKLVQKKIKNGVKDGKLVEYKDWNKIYNSKETNRDFAACTDVPNNAFYRELSQFYPNAKIILTVRDANKWYDSCQTTIFKIGQLMHRKWLLKWMSWGTPYFIRNTWNLMMLMGQKNVNTFEGMNKFENDKQYAINAFNEWNNSVQKYCTKHNKQLLVYQLKEGWIPLCKFLEVDIPNKEFPHSNSREEYAKIIKTMNMLCSAVNVVIAVGVTCCVGGYWYYNKYYLKK
eukprot:293777_1